MLVANGQTSGGGLRAAPHASLDDGWLDVIVIRDGTPLDLTGLAARFVLSDYLQSEQILYRRAKKVAFQSNPAMDVTADGDVVADEPVQITLMEQVLTAVVGPDYPPFEDTAAQI